MRRGNPAKRRSLIASALAGLIALLGPAHAQEADPILDAAAAYAAFRIDVQALGETQIETADDLERALDRAAGHNSDALSRGWVAHGALSAARSTAFAAGIASVVRRYGRTAVLRALTRDPTYPGRRRGYGDAVALILATSAAEARSSRQAADRFEATAARPHLWADAGSPADRAARLRRLGAAPFVPRAELPSSVIAFEFAAPEPALRLAPGRAETVRRMASLAAMRILNARGDWRAHMVRMLDDAPTRSCFELEQLQFYQCVGVTHAFDEAAFCLSGHALRGASACMGALAGRT